MQSTVKNCILTIRHSRIGNSVTWGNTSSPLIPTHPLKLNLSETETLFCHALLKHKRSLILKRVSLMFNKIKQSKTMKEDETNFLDF